MERQTNARGHLTYFCPPYMITDGTLTIIECPDRTPWYGVNRFLLLLLHTEDPVRRYDVPQRSCGSEDVAERELLSLSNSSYQNKQNMCCARTCSDTSRSLRLEHADDMSCLQNLPFRCRNRALDFTRPVCVTSVVIHLPCSKLMYGVAF